MTSNFNNNSSSNLISPFIKFWLYLVLLIPSIICTLFILYYLLFDRTLRHSLNNHVIIVLLFTVLFCELTQYPWMMYYHAHNNIWSRPYIFCLIWGFIDWAVYMLQLLLFAWASIERHILIFHDKWVATKKKRLFVHYLPLVIIITYWLIFYTYVYFYSSCRNRFNIRLSTKFWRFFQKFYFCFFTSKVQLVFRYIFTITIYHLSPTFWQRRDPALVEVLGFFIKELDKLRFDIAFVLELFIT